MQPAASFYQAKKDPRHLVTTVTNGWCIHQTQPQPQQVHLEQPQGLSRSCPSGAVKTTVPRSCGCTCSTWGPLRYQVYPVSMYLRGPPKCRPEVHHGSLLTSQKRSTHGPSCRHCPFRLPTSSQNSVESFPWLITMSAQFDPLFRSIWGSLETPLGSLALQYILQKCS